MKRMVVALEVLVIASGTARYSAAAAVDPAFVVDAFPYVADLTFARLPGWAGLPDPFDASLHLPGPTERLGDTSHILK